MYRDGPGDGPERGSPLQGLCSRYICVAEKETHPALTCRSGLVARWIGLSRMGHRATALAVLTAASLMLAPTGVGAGEVSDRDIKVGRLQRSYLDPGRSNWQGDGPRPLVATIWYHARDDSIETDWRGGVFRFGRTALGAPFPGGEPRPQPLIVLSHGTGGSAGQLSWLAEALVRDGFLVAAVNHHGNTSGEAQPAVAGRVLPGERSRDLTVLIDRLLADETIGPRIDVRRIGAAGFALGGYAVLSLAGLQLTFDEILAYCESRESAADTAVCHQPPEAKPTLADVRTSVQSDPVFRAAAARAREPVIDERVRAVYAIAPALLPVVPAERWAAVRAPAAIVVADKDRQVPAEVIEPLVRRRLPGAELVHVADAGHYVFLAVCTLRGLLLMGTLCRDPDVTDRAEVHDRIGRDAARFFAARLDVASPYQGASRQQDGPAPPRQGTVAAGARE